MWGECEPSYNASDRWGKFAMLPIVAILSQAQPVKVPRMQRIGSAVHLAPGVTAMLAIGCDSPGLSDFGKAFFLRRC